MVYTNSRPISDPSGVPEGLHAIQAEFFTENLVVHGRIISPDIRLSDHLNSSLPAIEIQVYGANRILTGAPVDLPGAVAHVNKAHLLFTIPREEPHRPASNAAWTRTVPKRCWAGLGRYTIQGKVHVEPSREPRLILRSLEHRQFIPITEAMLQLPEGGTLDCSTVIVNRVALEMLALREG